MQEEFNIHVHEVRQTTSSRDYVVIFDADVLLLPDDPSVMVRLVNTVVRSAFDENELQARAIRSIHQGVESVLRPRGMGAIVEVSNLVAHPIDFVDEKFTEFIAVYLASALVTTDS